MVNFPAFPTAYWAKLPENSKPALVWERGDFPYFSFLNAEISWREFHQLIVQAVDYFRSLGIRPQQNVAYCGTSRLAGVLAYCGVIALGGRILMLNPTMNDRQIQQILADKHIDFCLTDQHFADFSANSTACELPAFDWQQPATLTLTSGSSGKPKAVVHSAQNHLANAEGVCELMQFSAENSWLLSLPLFHVSGQGIVWRWLSQGATLFLHESKNQFFSMLNQVSHASLVPTQLQRYLAHSPQAHGKKFLLGGTAIPAELVAEAQQHGISTFSGYGMTEMASTICAVQNELDSVGFPLKGREIRLVENEIWVRGAGLALGYLQENGEIAPLVNSQGWLQTKDKGQWNAQGKLVVQGRLDNMFISGGENIQPEEIEKMLFQSGLIAQVFILPKADLEFGQRPVAFVQFKSPFSTEKIEQLKIWLADKIEKFKQPIAYFSLENIPGLDNGVKVSRQQLANYFKGIENNG